MLGCAVADLDSWDYSSYLGGGDIASFMIEENGCPGTGVVWSALSDHMEAHDEAGTCWACALEGKNEVVA
jgi:hypothetical protein